jgi:hypothetical protein
MSTETPLNIKTLAQASLTGLGLSDQQIRQLGLLVVNHHLTPLSVKCQTGTVTAHMDKGKYKQKYSHDVYFLHLSAEGKIVSPHDNDIYSLLIVDGNHVVYKNTHIRVGDDIVISYNPGWSVNLDITLTCVSNPHKTADIVFQGKGCVG